MNDFLEIIQQIMLIFRKCALRTISWNEMQFLFVIHFFFSLPPSLLSLFDLASFADPSYFL